MTKILNDEEQKKLERKKKIAMLRASNELLEESKKKVMENTKLDELSRAQRVKDIERAQEENFVNAEKQNIATRQEIMDAEYGEVSQEYIDKYNEHLKKKGLTQEQVARKDITVAVGENEEKGRRRRKSIKEKKSNVKNTESTSTAKDETEVVVPLEKEREIMNATRISDDANMDEVVKRRDAQIKSDIAKGKDEIQERLDAVVSGKKVEASNMEERPVENNETKRVSKKNKKIRNSYSFDFSTIPSNVQYDMIPLPSKGECYPNKCDRLPVAYLTAADENIIASPNMYRDGKIIDVILKRKILDKSIKIEELCKGDRDAIILWLRATGYGVDFPIITRNPTTNRYHNITVKLDTFKYKEFNLEGDENGFFTYETTNGDTIKFKFLTNDDEETLREMALSNSVDVAVSAIKKKASEIGDYCGELYNVDDEIKNDLQSCVEDIKDLVNEIEVKEIRESDHLYTDLITGQMLLHIISVNDNDDKDFVRNYVENMRAGDARKFRDFVGENKPGVDFKIKVDLPEEEGGSFETFLRFDDSVFINI